MSGKFRSSIHHLPITIHHLMKSMTGFGRGNATGEAFNATVEIKTVNNRFLDIHLRMSQELAPLEMNIRKLISAKLSRGRVDLSINLDRTGDATIAPCRIWSAAVRRSVAVPARC